MRSKLIQIIIAIAATAGVVAAITLFQKSTPNIERIPASSKMEDGVSPDEVSAVERMPKWTPDKAKLEAYEFTRKIKADLNTKVLADVAYSGLLFVEWSGNVGRFTFKLKNIEGAQNERSSNALSALSEGIFIEAQISEDYTLISMREPEVTSEEAQDVVSFLKDLVALYAFKTNEDTAGHYQATLKKIDDVTWLKKKLKYNEAKFSAQEITKSIHEIKLAALKEWSGVEDTKNESSKSGEHKAFIHTQTSYIIKQLNVAQVSNLSKPTYRDDFTLHASTVQIDAKIKVLTPIDWESARAELDSMDSLSNQARLELFHKMIKALKSNPGKLAEFSQWLKANLNDPRKANLGIGVLATVGTPAAQQELVGIYKGLSSTQAPVLEHTILNSFATTDAKLTNESRAFLNGVMDQHDQNPDTAINAAFALGTAIQKEPNAGDERKLSSLAEKATSLEERLAYLDAMGNSGSSSFLPFISGNVSAPESQIRETAVFALRYVNDESVKSIFEKAMMDPSVGVQISVVKAIPYQKNPIAYQPLLNQCAKQASDARVKALCSQTLSAIGS